MTIWFEPANVSKKTGEMTSGTGMWHEAATFREGRYNFPAIAIPLCGEMGARGAEWRSVWAVRDAGADAVPPGLACAACKTAAAAAPPMTTPGPLQGA